MRKCVVRMKDHKLIAGNPGALHEVIVEKPAIFHQFGSDWHYANDAGEKFQVTVAIVELEDGSVRYFEPQLIRFTE